MLHSFDSASRKSLLEELKPLIILYLEDYDDKDPVTEKPRVKKTNLPNIYKVALQYGITEKEWESLLSEFKDTRVGFTLQIKWHLRSIKEDKNDGWNIYWNKAKILQKIEDIIAQKVRENSEK